MKCLYKNLIQSLAYLPLLSVITYACSGSGAVALIEKNQTIVNIYGITAIITTLATMAFYYFRQMKGLPAIIASLFLIFFHPIWHYGGGGGDCGKSMVQMAMMITLLLTVPLLFQIVLWKFRRAHTQIENT